MIDGGDRAHTGVSERGAPGTSPGRDDASPASGLQPGDTTDGAGNAPAETDDTADAVRTTVAEACRILAHAGLAEDILGHVSVRSPCGRGVFVRSRGPRERGLLFTRPEDVHETLGDGAALPDGYRLPNEFPIHDAILRSRPDVAAVVHVHPPAVVASDLAGLPLRPIVGAYNIPAMRMARSGLPVYPRSVLINSSELGTQVAETLGGAAACILRGHGIATVGETVEQAVVRALNLESLARMTLDSARGGSLPDELPADDAELLPDLGSWFNDGYVWAYRCSLLALAGLGIAG